MTGRLGRVADRILPDTVIGRTAAILVLALVVSLAASLNIFIAQRSQTLLTLGVRDAAERVAAIARLIEEAPAATRPTLVHRLDTPGFRVGWGNVPLVAVGDRAGLGAEMARRLRADFGWTLVRVAANLPPPPGRRMPGPHLVFRAGAGTNGLGPALRISVRLNDGTWLNVFAPLHRPGTLWRWRFVAPLILSLAMVMAAALLAARHVARPFGLFAAAAERLGVDVAAPALSETGPREVRRAAHAFNVMQERIHRLVRDRTQMLAAISHDLRTPITRLKLRVEFVEEEAERERMLADLDEMERMIAATLAFARDDAAHEERRPTDIAALLQGLIDDLAATGAEAAYDGPDSLVAPARPMALKRAMVNLLDNGVKYGCRVRVALREIGDDRGQGEVEIVIEDDGPGIPETERERVFSPFVRLEGSRSRDTGGTGLGLSIARAAIRAHGGDIALAEGAKGGLRVTVTLPSA